MFSPRSLTVPWSFITTRFSVFSALTLVLLAACSTGDSTGRPDSEGERADQASSATAAAPRSFTLAAGTRIDATIVQTISSRHAKTGDTFTATVARDVTQAGGRVVVPAGSTVQGTITDVSPAPNTTSVGTLTLAVTSLTVHGKTQAIQVSIDSLATVSEGRGIEPVDVARVAGGAAAGAVLGRVIGGNAKGTIIGGVIGGAAGAAVSVAMKDMDIVLPAGSLLMLTLQDRLTVPAR